MIRKRVIAIMLIPLIALVSLSLVTGTALATTTVMVQNIDGSSFVEDKGTISVMITDVVGVKGTHILLEYNNSVVNVVDIGNSDFGFESYKDINNTAGYVRYAVFNLNQLNGDLTIAEIVLKRVSSGSSPLTLTVVALNNGTAEIPRDVIGATLSETGVITPGPTSGEKPTPKPEVPPLTLTPESTLATQTGAPAASTPKQVSPTPTVSGFEAVLTIAGLLVLGYLVWRKTK